MNQLSLLMPYFSQLEKEDAFAEYSQDHIICKAIKNDDAAIRNFCRYNGYNSLYPPNASSFIVNIINRLESMKRVFMHDPIISFIKNQMSAGKNQYDEALFIQAFSEIELLAYLSQGYYNHISDAIYEPLKGGNKQSQDSDKNPEAYIRYDNGVSLYIEIKTPRFPNLTFQVNDNGIIQPNILFDINHKQDYDQLLSQYKYIHRYNSLAKIKSFIYSAIHKFNYVPEENTYNILAINYTMSPWKGCILDEPLSLFFNPATGLLHKNSTLANQYLFSANQDGNSFTRDELSKISAFLIYFTTPMEFLFSDWRCAKGNCILLKNPYASAPNISVLESIFNTKCSEIDPIINDFSLFYYALPNQAILPLEIKTELTEILLSHLTIL